MHITAAHVIRMLEQRPSASRGRVRQTRLIRWHPESQLFPLAAALFGLPYENETLSVPHVPLGHEKEATFQDLVGALIGTIERLDFTWLQLANHDLNIATLGGATVPPTIVLVGRTVEDLALFWNRRIEGNACLPQWILPVPLESAEDPGLAELLLKWVAQFQRLSLRPNFLFIQSSTVPATTQADLANRLRREFGGSPIKYVDVWPETNKLPTVVPFEREELVVVQRSGQRVTWQQPASALAELFKSRISWMVDLLEDHRDRRSPFELCLPANSTTYDVLNAPGPPTVNHSIVQKFAWGTDSISVHCEKRDEMVSHWLPSSREILEEMLAAHGLEPVKDEKRACYKPALKVLGGFGQASLAFSGKKGSILQALAKGPARLDELLALMKLGNGRLPELDRSKYLDILFQNLSPTKQRVADRRFRRFWSRTLPSEDKLGGALRTLGLPSHLKT